jgi:hypothetical protein
MKFGVFLKLFILNIVENKEREKKKKKRVTESEQNSSVYYIQ